MSSKFIQAGRMESQYLETGVLTVNFQTAGVNDVVSDGTLAILGDFALESVYTSAFGSNIIDKNTRVAKLPTSATVAGVGVIDLAGIPTVSGQGNTYRLGSKTIGLTADASVPVRFRVLKINDTLTTGSENFTASPTVGQYAIVDTTGNWAPSATIPVSGLVAKVQSSEKISQGTEANVTSYFLLIIQLA